MPTIYLTICLNQKRQDGIKKKRGKEKVSGKEYREFIYKAIDNAVKE